MPKTTGKPGRGNKKRRIISKINRMSQGVNEMINDGFLLLYHVKMRLSKISFLDPLKIVKFFEKRTFRRTALEPRNQMR
jgi:hypothetical protein